MPTLVFDIETSALPLEHFDETQQEYLYRELQKLPEGPERETRRVEITRQFNLWPLTAQVVCIGMLNSESLRGQALFIAEDFEADAGEAGPVEPWQPPSTLGHITNQRLVSMCLPGPMHSSHQPAFLSSGLW